MFTTDSLIDDERKPEVTKSDPPYLSFNNSLPVTVNLDNYSQYSLKAISQPMYLSRNWTLWVQITLGHNNRYHHYEDCLKQIATFGTVQKFWQIWSLIPQPSTIIDNNKLVYVEPNEGGKAVDALMLFQSGIQPTWEDSIHKDAYCLTFTFNFPYYKAGRLDEIWNTLVLSLIGNSLQHGENFTGLRLVEKLGKPVSKFIRIELWINCKVTDPDLIHKMETSIYNCLKNSISGEETSSVCERSKLGFSRIGRT